MRPPCLVFSLPVGHTDHAPVLRQGQAVRYVEAVGGQRQGERSGSLAPLEHLVHLVLAVLDRHAVLDNPGVAVAVGHEERVGVLGHGHGGGFAVVSVVATGNKLDKRDDN